MAALKLRTVSATLIAALGLSLAACSDDGGSTSATGGAPTSGGQSAAFGGSVGNGGTGAGSSLGSGGASGGSSSGGSAAGGAASGGAAPGSGGSGNGGASNGGTAGVGGERTGGTGAGGASSGGSGGKAGSGGAATGGNGSGGAAGGAASGGSSGSSSGGSASGGGSSFKPCPATGACKIMPFGDSITQGFNVNGGYRAPLFHLALAANRNITFVGGQSDYSVPSVDGMTFPKNHEGHGGYTINGNMGIAQYVTSRMPNYKPNIVTLMIGTNDINGNVNVSDAPNRLGSLLDAIFTQDPNILVVLAQIVPTRNDGTNNTIKTYNAAMPNLVSKQTSQGRHIVLVDMYGAFTKNSNYKNALLGDNLHPNQAGYVLMAEVWFQALSPYLQ